MPSVAQVNTLVRELPISAEELLRAMGYRFNPPAAARLPRRLIDLLLLLPPERIESLIELLGPIATDGGPEE